MKPWTFDIILGVVITAGMGIAMLLVFPLPVFVIWVSGIAAGYGLRIGLVNMWPHIFKPRLTYKQQRPINSDKSVTEG